MRLATLKDRQRESLEVKIAGHQTKGTPCQEQENLEWINPPLITDELWPCRLSPAIFAAKFCTSCKSCKAWEQPSHSKCFFFFLFFCRELHCFWKHRVRSLVGAWDCSSAPTFLRLWLEEGERLLLPQVGGIQLPDSARLSQCGLTGMSPDMTPRPQGNRSPQAISSQAAHAHAAAPDGSPLPGKRHCNMQNCAIGKQLKACSVKTASSRKA